MSVCTCTIYTWFYYYFVYFCYNNTHTQSYIWGLFTAHKCSWNRFIVQTIIMWVLAASYRIKKQQKLNCTLMIDYKLFVCVLIHEWDGDIRVVKRKGAINQNDLYSFSFCCVSFSCATNTKRYGRLPNNEENTCMIRQILVGWPTLVWNRISNVFLLHILVTL